MILWWLGNLIFLVLVLTAAVLAWRVIVEALEIHRYAEDILTHGVGLTGTLDPLPALNDTVTLAAQVEDRAVAYLTALEAKLSG